MYANQLFTLRISVEGNKFALKYDQNIVQYTEELSGELEVGFYDQLSQRFFRL